MATGCSEMMFPKGTGPGRPYGGAAVYSRVPLKEGYPYAHNVNGIEFTIIKTESNPHLNIIGLYISFTQYCYITPTVFTT